MAEGIPGARLPRNMTVNASVEPDDSFYTWTSFFSILAGQATPEERNKYFATLDLHREEADCARCTSQLSYLFSYSPIIRFMRENINKLGQDINMENVRCKRCTTNQAGGFDSEYGIMICANQMKNKGHLEDTLAHEMVHAWDHLRFKVDRRNLRHAACTEVSASSRLRLA